jgi:hypothetical protein
MRSGDDATVIVLPESATLEGSISLPATAAR